MRLSLVVTIVSVMVIAGCMGPPKVDPMAFQVTPADAERVSISAICKPQYESKKATLAIAEFTNNTTFGKMQATNTNTKGQIDKTKVSAGAVGVVATPGAAGLGYVGAEKSKTKYSQNVETFMRQISPKIGEYAQAAVENTVVNVGGIDVFDRNNLQDIMNEQKFQMTVADPDTAVRLGKLAGVKYIVVGSVDNIAAKYIPPSKQQNNQQGWLGVAMALGQAAANTQSGWNVNVEMTVKVLDVETGKAFINKKVKGREIGGGKPDFNPELVVQAAKKAMGEAVDDLKPVLSDRFAMKGYITQLRGNKQVALVSLGKANGLKAGQKLVAYDFIEITDPMTNAVTCTKAKIPVEITVSDQVDDTTSWVKIEPEKKKESSVQRLKTGTLIQRAKLKGQSMFKKMF